MGLWFAMDMRCDAAHIHRKLGWPMGERHWKSSQGTPQTSWSSCFSDSMIGVGIAMLSGWPKLKWADGLGYPTVWGA